MEEYTNDQLIKILYGGAKAFAEPENFAAKAALYYASAAIIERCGEGELSIAAFLEEPTDDHTVTLNLIKQLILVSTTDQPDGMDIVVRVMLEMELARRMSEYVPSEV